MAQSQMAIFIDYENMVLSAREHGAVFSLDPVMEMLRARGRPALVKAYGDWSTSNIRQYPRDLRTNAVELVQLYRYGSEGKNRADIALAVDAIDALYQLEHIEIFVLITGDSDYAPLASKIRQMGKSVIGIGIRGATSSLLVVSCDEFFYYDTLVAQAGPRLDPSEVLDLTEKALRALQQIGETRVTAERLRQVMTGLDPSFTLSAVIQQHGSFDAFLQASGGRVHYDILDGVAYYRLSDRELLEGTASLLPRHELPSVLADEGEIARGLTPWDAGRQLESDNIEHPLGTDEMITLQEQPSDVRTNLKDLIGERAYQLLGTRIEESLSPRMVISVAEARRLFEQGQGDRRLDFQAASRALLQASQVQWQLVRRGYTAGIADLQWYVASVLSAEAGSRYINGQYESAIPVYLAFFSMLEPAGRNRLWQDVRGLMAPMLSYYFILATKLARERDPDSPSRARPGDLVTLLAWHENDRVIANFRRLTRELVTASPWVAKELVRLVKTSMAGPETIAGMFRVIGDLLPTDSGVQSYLHPEPLSAIHETLPTTLTVPSVRDQLTEEEAAALIQAVTTAPKLPGHRAITTIMTRLNAFIGYNLKERAYNGFPNATAFIEAAKRQGLIKYGQPLGTHITIYLPYEAID